MIAAKEARMLAAKEERMKRRALNHERKSDSEEKETSESLDSAQLLLRKVTKAPDDILHNSIPKKGVLKYRGNKK